VGLSTYGQLRAAVADWLERDDLTERTADFIALAESRLNRSLRARCLESDQTLTATPGSRVVSLPPGFREALSLWLETATGRCPLIFRDPVALEVDKTPGLPRAFGIDGGQLVFDRPFDRAYSLTLRMLGRLSLSDSQPSNGVLTDYPDLYLFGALVEAAPICGMLICWPCLPHGLTLPSPRPGSRRGAIVRTQPCDQTPPLWPRDSYDGDTWPWNPPGTKTDTGGGAGGVTRNRCPEISDGAVCLSRRGPAACFSLAAMPAPGERSQHSGPFRRHPLDPSGHRRRDLNAIILYPAPALGNAGGR